ncbi:MAG TPA: quinone-dependent dihydroorotate dehydrogenase [Burkholderiaceae bacterium]|nr:quinone-dependent dihydroorotate dehydrogenase [Burkholderiaceae bacterium]
MYGFARALLFTLDPETAHHLTLRALAAAHAAGATHLLHPALPDDPVRVMGLTFPNPVGLAAGLDKNAAFVEPLAQLGFGSLEVGTVTPRPQPGNPRPRLFRLPQAGALINRLGFNNEGVDALVACVRALRSAPLLGINLGKNVDTPIERAADDYAHALAAVYPHASYVTINISSPNTRDLRTLQGASELDTLLAHLGQERARLSDQHGRRVPIAVKIAPDLADDDIKRIADALVAHGLDAVIATNTTVARDAVAGLANAQQTGGLSGRPLLALSNRVLSTLAAHLQGALPLIGVGGIASAADAVEKLRAGASLVQLYTGLIYRGPGLVAECRRAMAQWRKAGNPHPRPSPASGRGE